MYRDLLSNNNTYAIQSGDEDCTMLGFMDAYNPDTDD